MDSDDFFYASVENSTQQGLVLNPGIWDNKEMLNIEKIYFTKGTPWYSFEPKSMKHMEEWMSAPLLPIIQVNTEKIYYLLFGQKWAGFE